MTVRNSILGFFIVLTLSGLTLGSIASAQTQRSGKLAMSPEQWRAFRLNEIDEAIKEKAKGNFVAPHTDKRDQDETEAIIDGKVSTSAPESEVHAAVNPRDTTNIVI